jgi:MFS family permease
LTRRWWALAVLCLALSVIVIDNTILAVALPSIRHQLHASETDLQWISTAYGLVLAGLLLPLAVLGDRRGRKGLLLAGLAIFGLASAAAALAETPLALSIARGFIGLGGACAMPATLSIISSVFDEAERPRAIAIWSGTAGITAVAGPVVGGLLLAHFWWGSVFLVNVPVALVTMIAAALLVPTSRDPAATPVDLGSAWRWWGTLTFALLAIIEGPQQGWASPVVIGAAIVALVLGFAFARRERRSEHPLVPAETVRDIRLKAGAVTVTASFFGMFGVQFVVTQWLQGPQGLTALAAAAYFVPIALATVAGALLTPRAMERLGGGGASALGLGSFAVGTGFVAVGIATGSVVTVAGSTVFLGFGFGIGTSAGPELIMSTATEDRAGSAAGVNETLVEAGGSLGVAVLGSVFAATGSYAWPIPVAGVVGLVAAVGVARALSGPRSGHRPTVGQPG